MAFAFVLYIEDTTVSPALHLIRKLCNPNSKSRPHITIRAPIEKLKNNDFTEYQNMIVNSIDIIKPGSFNLHEDSESKAYTVYLECNVNRELVAWTHKPDFPYSDFHITLYEGSSIRYARNLLRILEQITWGYKVQLPQNTKLTKIGIGKDKNQNKEPSASYFNNIHNLFQKITDQKYDESLIRQLSQNKRLVYIQNICLYLREATKDFEKVLTSVDHTDIDTEIHKEKLKDNAYSLNRALYLTPPELANDIMKYVISQLDDDISHIDFGDPAVGTGVFYSILLNNVNNNRIRSAIGIDIDKNMVNKTRKLWSDAGLKVEHGDYLHMDQIPKRSLIVANPPYIRYQKIPSSYKQKLQERAQAQIGIHIDGQSNLYTYFLLLSHAWMQPNAIAAWLIPSEFMDHNYGEVIRRYLTQKVELIRIHKFSSEEFQFENALVSSSVVIFRNKEPDYGRQVQLSHKGTLAEPKYVEEVDLKELVTEPKWKIPWIKRNQPLSNIPHIGDIFHVTRGLATGANDFFILEREEAKKMGLPNIALRPVLPKARSLSTNIVEREPDGYPRIMPQYCLLDCNLSEETIRAEYPALYDYLQSAELKVRNAKLVQNRKIWYKQEQRIPSPFLCTYMGRGSKEVKPLRFIWNKSDAIVTNTYLMLYPNATLKFLLEDGTVLYEQLFDLLQKISISNLIEHGREYGGGLHKIEPNELSNVQFSSFPDWLKENVGEVIALR